MGIPLSRQKGTWGRYFYEIGKHAGLLVVLILMFPVALIAWIGVKIGIIPPEKNFLDDYFENKIPSY